MLNKLLPYNKSIHQGDITYVAMYLTLSDPGYFRQLTTRWGGGVKSPTPPPLRSRNHGINLYHIIHVHVARCFRHVPIRLFQKFAILTISERFQNKK